MAACLVPASTAQSPALLNIPCVSCLKPNRDCLSSHFKEIERVNKFNVLVKKAVYLFSLFFFFFSFLLESGFFLFVLFFTMLCVCVCVLLCSKANQTYVYIYALFFVFPSRFGYHRALGRVPCAKKAVHLIQEHTHPPPLSRINLGASGWLVVISENVLWEPSCFP